MSRQASWSLARRLRSRLYAVIALITTMVTISIAIHYGRDIPELHQRTVYDLTNHVARELPPVATRWEIEETVARTNPIFARYPDAYDWAVLDRNGDLVAGSHPGSFERTAFPPGLPPDEWSSPCGEQCWEAGKTYRSGDAVWHVVAVAHKDPAGLLWWLVLDEVLMHIILPILPFSVLILFATTGIINRILVPLHDLAAQARRVHSLHDIRPLDATGSPIEVADLVQSLNTALGGLRDSIERERSFLMDASHALRTPLAAVKARLELDGQHVDVRRLRGDIDALVRLTSQLLASANAERLVLDPHAIADLRAIAHTVVSDMTPLAMRAGVDLGLAANGPAEIRGDMDAISHALKNLVENALKFTPRGCAVTVEVSADPPRISVIDQGPGVPSARRTEIFARHSRARFGDGNGAGLGLSIVKRICNAHGGSTLVLDAPGGGSIFVMTFASMPAPLDVDMPLGSTGMLKPATV
jgi:two-component system OmpR family sensor kinase